MKIKKLKSFFLFSTVFLLIFFTGACLDIMSYRCKTEIIPAGKGIRAAKFKMGTYTDSSEKPGKVQIKWHEQLKEYQLEIPGSKGSNFRLMHLAGKNYLLQAGEEDYYNYSIIAIEGDIVAFLHIKENRENNVEDLIKTHGLELMENEELTGSREGLISFFSGLLRLDYLEPGEKIKYIGVTRD